MEKITAIDAENRAREFIGNRHPRVKRIRFTRTWREGDVWLVEGELWFKRAHFFTVRRSFRLRISGEDTSYEETKKLTVLTALGIVAFVSLYFIIFFFSLPFTRNATVSSILSLSITFGTLLALVYLLAYTLKPRKKRETKKAK